MKTLHESEKEKHEGMKARMEAIRLKQLLDPDALTEQELMCLQIEQNGFGCPIEEEVKRK